MFDLSKLLLLKLELEKLDANILAFAKFTENKTMIIHTFSENKMWIIFQKHVVTYI